METSVDTLLTELSQYLVPADNVDKIREKGLRTSLNGDENLNARKSDVLVWEWIGAAGTSYKRGTEKSHSGSSGLRCAVKN